MIEASEGLNVRVGAGPSSEKLSRGKAQMISLNPSARLVLCLEVITRKRETTPI